jgi:pimeloyl-ACP methyl ester carboxylesterase
MRRDASSASANRVAAGPRKRYSTAVRSRATKITSSGITIGLREWGEGTPVLLVHGTGLTSRYWSPLASMLAERFRATTVDLLGYGETSPWGGGDAFHFHADRDVVIAALEHAGEPSHIVGHSYGGLLALQAALNRPDLVRSLALYEPVAFSVLHSAQHAAGLGDLNRGGRGASLMDLETGGDESWLRMFVDYWNGPGAFDSMTQLARAGLLSTGRKAFLEVRSNLLDRTTHDDYARIAAPTLLLCGADSPMAAKATVEVLAGAMPNAERKVIEGAGHLGPFTHGDVVGRAILSLLDS